MNVRLIEMRPPRIAMTLLGVAATIHFLAAGQMMHLFSSVPVSAVLIPAGFSLMMAAWWQFRQRGVAICPTQPTGRLITDGVYRLTRNPMYLGILTMMAGVATGVGTAPFYAAAVAFFIVIDRVFCRHEEQKLNAAFGHDYQAYLLRVRRWL